MSRAADFSEREAGLEECVNESNFHQIEEAERQLTVGRLELHMPHGMGSPTFIAPSVFVASEPAADARAWNARQAASLGDSVEAHVDGC